MVLYMQFSKVLADDKKEFYQTRMFINAIQRILSGELQSTNEQTALKCSQRTLAGLPRPIKGFNPGGRRESP